MSTGNQAPPSPKVQSYLQAWGTSIGRVLQEVAWDAVIHHPLSGLQVTTKAEEP